MRNRNRPVCRCINQHPLTGQDTGEQMAVVAPALTTCPVLLVPHLPLLSGPRMSVQEKVLTGVLTVSRKNRENGYTRSALSLC